MTLGHDRAFVEDRRHQAVAILQSRDDEDLSGAVVAGQRTQAVWDRFYSLRQIWKRSRGSVTTLKARLAFLLISKIYRQMYANTGIATDSARVQPSAQWARLMAIPCRRLFAGRPMPELAVPSLTREVARAHDLEGAEREWVRTDRVGTRHRSAYRLCQAVPDTLALVVSQDGGLRFIRWHDDGVTYWEQIATGLWEL